MKSNSFFFLCLQHQLQQVTQQQNNLQTNNAQSLQDKMPRGKSVKPRGRMTAYAFFVQTCRQEHKKKHPEENIVFQEFSKKCASRWKVSLFQFLKRTQRIALNELLNIHTPKKKFLYWEDSSISFKFKFK